LYVRQAYRRGVLGRQLLEHVEQLAQAESCSRIEFTTDVENQAAQRFYGTVGYQPHRGKILFRRTLSTAADSPELLAGAGDMQGLSHNLVGRDAKARRS
jgi:hypothetical protein